MKIHRLLYCLFILIGFALQAGSTPAGQGGRGDDAAAHARSGDYLPTDLRARVEKLKADVSREPTTVQDYRQRAGVLWAWANAFALDGGVIPVDLPFLLGYALSWPQNAAVGLNTMLSIDRYTRELTVKEMGLNGIGTIVNDFQAAFPAGSWQTVRQVYTVGDMDMAAGGGILAAKHFLSDQGLLQHRDPTGDNYVAMACSNPDARFIKTTAPMNGIHGGGYAGGIPSLFFKLEAGALKKGDTITLTYGDRSGGSRGLQVQTYTNDFFPLPVYVDLEGEGNFFTLPIQPYAVEGTDAYGVKGFAPSVVGIGESFSLSVRTEDDFYNRATGAIPAYDILLNGRQHRAIPSGQEAVKVLDDLAFDAPGVYRFTIRSDDGAIVGNSNPIWVQENPVQRIYWGELHGHGGFAEGFGTPENYFGFGKEDARLDYISMTEHDIWMDDSEWATLRRSAEAYNESGVFVVFLGYEWTMGANQGGHNNVFFRTPGNRNRVGVHRAQSLSELYFGLRSENRLEDVLIIPHCHQPGDWRMNDPDLQILVEIFSQHGTFQWFGERYLERGYQMGFVAASDDHLGHPGYTGTMRGGVQRGGLTAVMATEKTNDAIFSALRDRVTYATSGERMILDVRVNGSAIGQRAPATAMSGEGKGAPIVQQMVTAGDASRDRKLQKGEAPQALKAYFDAIDTDRDGAIDMDEARRIDERSQTSSQKAERRIEGQVMGTAPIDTITVFKNGRSLWEKDYLTTGRARDSYVLVSFESSDEEFFREAPRGTRLWTGTMDVKGAELVGFSVPSFMGRYTEFAKRDPDNPNRIEFATGTRGRAKTILLELRDIADEAEIDIQLRATTEMPSSRQMYRRPAQIPAAQVVFHLSEEKNGQLRQTFKVDRYQDSITVRFIDPDGEMDRKIDVVDRESIFNDDYYYVRIIQLDGSTAWSSPIWVGGVPPT